MRKPLLIALSVIFVLASCTKIQTTDIGNGLIPPIDGVLTKDSIIDVITNTSIDSTAIRVYKSDDHIIGTISNDPYFGKTQASIFFELKPPSYPFSFQGKKEELIVDSAELILSYRSIYGDSLQRQTWRVFEIDNRDTLRYDSVYRTKDVIRTGSQIGERTNIDLTTLNDSVNTKFEKASNQIRIKLNASFAQKMIKTFDSSNAYKNDSLFRSRFAGFAVVPDQGSGNALISVNLLDTNTKLALYYKYKTTTTPIEDTPTVSYFRFAVNSGTATSGNANIIKRDYSGPNLLSTYLNNGKEDSILLVQTAPGTIVDVRVPGLSNFPNSIIHRAELIAEIVPTNNPMLDALLTPPRYLLLTAWDPTNKVKINIPTDFQVDAQGTSNIGAFGGFINTRDNGTTITRAYDFNLTRYVQGIVTRKETNYDLRISAPSNDTIRYRDPYPATLFNTYYIVPSTSNVIANGRVQLGGGGKTMPYRMRLRIIYSRI